ncbi:MAG: hypothetical protein QY326_05585 [Bdellovibrionota bacterium]|nr:MAG: hypothetical protein QY326_05585 [Bdellovibrionota bacterium]
METKFSFQLSEQDHCWYLHYSQFVAEWGKRLRRRTNLITVLFLLAALVSYRVITGTEWQLIADIPVLVVFVIFYLALFKRGMKREIPKLVKKQMQRYGAKAPVGEFTLLLNAEEVRETNPRGIDVRCGWDQIRRIEEIEHYVIIASRAALTFLIPLPDPNERRRLLELARQYWNEARMNMKPAQQRDSSELMGVVKQGVLGGLGLLIMFAVLQYGLQYLGPQLGPGLALKQVSEQLRIKRSEIVSEGEVFSVLGEIENSGDDVIQSYELEANFFDESGTFMEQCKYWSNGPLGPKRVAYFKIPCDETSPSRLRASKRHEVHVVSAYVAPEQP